MDGPAATPGAVAAHSGHAEVIALSGATAAMAAGGLAAALAQVATAAFAGPPWNEPAAQARRAVDRMLIDASSHGAFVLALAFTGAGPDLAGFAYGLPRWHLPTLAGQLPARPGHPPFEFCELAVRPAARGRGAGAALHQAILTTSGPQPRWLATHPAARPALALYRTRGWRTTRLIPGPDRGSIRLLMTRPH